MTLEGDDAIYDFALPGLLAIVTYQVGDTVDFTWVEGDGVRTATGFAGEEETVGTALADAGEAATGADSDAAIGTAEATAA